MDRGKLKGYGALLLVFVLGVLSGGAGSRAMLLRRFAHRSSLENRRLEALGRRLDLDSAQEAQLHAVLDEYGEQRRKLAREMMDRCGDPLRAQKTQMDGEIRRLLRPDQQTRYDTLVKDSNGRSRAGSPFDL